MHTLVGEEMRQVIGAYGKVCDIANVTAAPKYLVVKRKRGDFAKVSPFRIEKAILVYAGSVVQNIRKSACELLVKILKDQ